MLTKGGVYTCLRQHSIDPEAAHWWWEVIFRPGKDCLLPGLPHLTWVVLTCRSVYSPQLSLYTLHFPAEQSEYIVKLGVAKCRRLVAQQGTTYKWGGTIMENWEVPLWKGVMDTFSLRQMCLQEGELSFAKNCDFFQDEQKLGFSG